MSASDRIAARVQDDAVRVYRDAFGMPRLAQPNEDGSGWVVIVCVALLAGAYGWAWFLN